MLRIIAGKADPNQVEKGRHESSIKKKGVWIIHRHDPYHHESSAISISMVQHASVTLYTYYYDVAAQQYSKHNSKLIKDITYELWNSKPNWFKFGIFKGRIFAVYILGLGFLRGGTDRNYKLNLYGGIDHPPL